MAHAIETTDGFSHYAGSRELPWHRLGTTVDGDLTLPDALRLAKMTDWNVRTEPLVVVHEDGSMETMGDRHRLIVRDHPIHGTVSGIAPIGNQFDAVQNEELAEFAAAILDTSAGDLIADAVGSLAEGRKVFLTLRRPEGVLMGGADLVMPYLVLATGHDGGMSTVVRATNIRVVCQNTLTAALRGAGTFRIRHTGAKIDSKLEQARRVVGVAFDGTSELDKEIEVFLNTKFTAAQYEKVVNKVAPAAEKGATDRQQNAAEKKRDTLHALWSSETQKPIAGTAWAAVNAVGEWVDWFTTSDTAKESVKNKRAERAMFGKGDDVKALATATVRELAKIK